ncbi:MAG: 30S ribosomal protein S6 [Rhodothermaceae bacterium]|nr:30S ribosomal protein S6 [Rhodothermaceae bacterium]MXX96905.1 30S ribosomal protein S6 [Rhodothermaceae bacterium]MXZ18197.1 30S ribosomal protein S6 [Rhodothermaceae bacterium]MYE61955.1 30S ribosomal protein S6 [Rhodothermaceae bacterium]MYG69867.1 30S ribosomal protein S6 [Rhodothermaceae bacterium]
MAMNRKMYELTYILTSVLSNEQIAEVVARVNEMIEGAGGTIIEVDEWGTRKLAYPVDKKRNGYYVNLYFEGPGTLIPRIERALTIDDNVLRSLILAMDKSMVAHYQANKSSKKTAAKAESEEQ